VRACVRSCHANQPDVLWPHRWKHSFCSRLIWNFTSFSLIGWKQILDVRWPWPIYFAPNNFQRRSCSSKCLAGNREQFSKFLRIYPFYNDFSAAALSVCTVSPKRMHRLLSVIYCWKVILNGLFGGKFISRRGAISTRWARHTAIAVPLVKCVTTIVSISWETIQKKACSLVTCTVKWRHWNDQDHVITWLPEVTQLLSCRAWSWFEWPRCCRMPYPTNKLWIQRQRTTETTHEGGHWADHLEGDGKL
jgi:hypothetical protein